MQGPSVKIEDLRTIGWSTWYPIGLADDDGQPPEGAEDEYDSYLLQVAAGLINGKGSDVAISYLVNIAAEHMGLGHTHETAATATVDQIKTHFLKLGYDVP